uniref:NADH-ubiquinone oxidoreductase chain 5 n=1 Tax=Bemisia tabaci TaxID=7038 RepID=A0A7S7YGB7_BEMTA|nr:NADH dehydrogenase subunit 5 [Bemisia tabaci]
MIKNTILFMWAIVILMTLFNPVIFKKSSSMMIEWKLMSTKSSDMNMFFLLDEKSLTFVLIVLMVTASILMYSQFYMDKKKMMFSKMLTMFMLFMLMLILSPNMVSLVMGWEGLGMTSFILIMYYQNKKSMMSSMYTMMMNRIGDITLFMSMMILMNSNSWMFLSTQYLDHKLTWVSLILTSMFSKSAQIPFSSWLTEAMAAPTPVSALVHSSTLVTAGVYLMIRFKSSIISLNMEQVILTISMMTLTMASMNSLSEMDMKKLVALSTLSQISIMFISISVNLYSLAFFHMIVHATFKALIFLCSSTFISMTNTQDLRKISSANVSLVVTKISFNTASMTLCALPFLSSFYSKEIIMEMIMVKSLNKIMGLTFTMMMMVTAIYSLKMMTIINLNKMTSVMKITKETSKQKLSKIFLLMPSVILGNKMLWSVDLSWNVNYLSLAEKMTPTILIMVMIVMVETDKKSKIVKPNNSLNQMVTYMWFMKNLNIMSKMKFMNQAINLNMTTEKGILVNQASGAVTLMYKTTEFMLKMSQINLKNMMLIMISLMIALL